MSNIKAKIIYNENCGYKKSKIETDLPLIKQDINFFLSFNNLYHNNKDIRNNLEENQDDVYFNDILEICVQCQFNNEILKYGIIKLYFFDFENKEEKLLCSELIDKNGQIKCLHIPHHSGYYYAKYENIDDEYFNESISEYMYIELKEIPTNISINSKNQFVKLEETVKLEVHVKDIYNNPVEYGNVSFLSYKNDIAEESGFGVPISDPISLDENGYGVLEYSPIQYGKKNSIFDYEYLTTNFYYTYLNNKFVNYIEEDIDSFKEGDVIYDTLLSDNIEIILNEDGDIVVNYNDENCIQNQQTESIKASYNFHQKKYNNNSFRYYRNSNSWTTINIIQNNNIVVSLGILEDDKFNNNLKRNEYNGIYEIENDDDLCIQCKIVDNNKRIIKFYEKNLPKIKINLIGTTYTGEEINQTIDGSFIKSGEESYIDNINGEQKINYFTIYQGLNSYPLPKGTYYIYCEFEGGYGLPIDTEINEIGIKKDSVIPKLKYYDKIESIKYGFNIKNKSENLKILLTADKDEIILGEKIIITAKLLSENETPFDANFIAEYLMNDNIKIKVKNYNSNEIKEIVLDKKLEGTFEYTPTYTSDFVFYASSNQIIIKDYLFKKGKEINSLKVKVKNDAYPILNFNILETKFPGKITYNVKLKENTYCLNDLYNVDIKISSNNGYVYSQYALLQNDNIFNETIDGIPAGEYIISAKINNNTIKQSFSIEKSDINISKINPTNNNILAQNYDFIYEINTNTEFIENLIINFLDEEIELFSCEKIDNRKYLLKRNVDLFNQPKEETLTISINGNENYNSFEYNEQISSVTIDPEFLINKDIIKKEILLSISLPEEWGGFHTGEYVLGMATVVIDDKEECCFLIFDDNGEANLTFNSFTDIEWQSLDRKIIINTYSTFGDYNISTQDDIIQFLIERTNSEKISYSDNFDNNIINLYNQYLLYKDIICVCYGDTIQEKILND